MTKRGHRGERCEIGNASFADIEAGELGFGEHGQCVKCRISNDESGDPVCALSDRKINPSERWQPRKTLPLLPKLSHGSCGPERLGIEIECEVAQALVVAQTFDGCWMFGQDDFLQSGDTYQRCEVDPEIRARG